MSSRKRVDTHGVIKRLQEQGEVEAGGGCGDGIQFEEGLMDAIKAASRPREEVESHLAALCDAVKEYQWIGECCMVNWLSLDLWKLVKDRGWDEELEGMSNAEISALSVGELGRELSTPSLAKFVRDCSGLRLDAANKLPLDGGRARAPLVAMSSKKEHEVQVMSRVCASIAHEAGATCVVDIGSGKGYLTTAVASGYGLTTVGIDSLQGNTDGAIKRHALVSRIATGVAGGSKEGAAGVGEFVAVTGYVRMEGGNGDEFVELLQEKSAGKVKKGDVLLMAGLHTCGDLAPTMLRSFVGWGTVKGFCGVGCCYNLLTQESDNHTFDIFGATQDDVEKRGRHPGFPLSALVKDKGVYLNRNCRNLAAHSHRPVYTAQPVMTPEERSCAYRASLQSLWVSKLVHHAPSELQTGNISVGKIAAKCPTLADYIRRAQTKLMVPHQVVRDAEIASLWELSESTLRRNRIFSALRHLLAHCVESLILLDRLLFLQSSSEIEVASLVPLFDPVTSPRCFAVCGLRR